MTSATLSKNSSSVLKNHGVFWKVMTLILSSLLIFQWMAFSMIWSHGADSSQDDHPRSTSRDYHRLPQRIGSIEQQLDSTTSLNLQPQKSSLLSDVDVHNNERVFQLADTDGERDSRNVLNIEDNNHQEGVAITLMLKAPKWFHRRYTAMLHNILANIPQDYDEYENNTRRNSKHNDNNNKGWRVQIFVNQAWLEKDVLPLHPGLRRLYGPDQYHTSMTQSKKEKGAAVALQSIEKDTTASWTTASGRITWTPLPDTMTKQRPKDIMKSVWLWEHVLAENVLLFGGNGAVCANHQQKSDWNQFLSYDYVGTPWNQKHGMGGDGGTHSFRHRSTMLSILRNHPPAFNDDEKDMLDYQYFLKYLLKDDQKYKVANRSMTQLFGGFTELDQAPLLISGTQPGLNLTMRENLLSICPELRMIFPSMHEPACFGAHPNGAKCKESICALRDVIPPQGC